ncbi:hypothetical protein HanXRQr2_Chr02g0064121 [Helianthus annuus]|uniref:Uncharacterized protein n=1 Tax=Helianthus annuus TaxID=4232 RepID=A0A9K3JN96_HELAN|nr:hypothetical protein HanXRQr2_Chr02g0064121 [Helianthus annuus]KAJ0951668.1 hypothetical protein HanPSC8_Chr02g0062951 [Helianthus annuus]
MREARKGITPTPRQMLPRERDTSKGREKERQKQNHQKEKRRRQKLPQAIHVLSVER